MKQLMRKGAVLSTGLLLWGCAPSPEAGRTGGVSSASPEGLYQEGHQLYLAQQYESAETLLRRAVAMDSSYTPALRDLAALHYELGMREGGEKSPGKMQHVREARRFFSRIEALGNQESDLYERLCELSVALDDDRAFVRYAKMNADKYPYDRQYHNLGLAYFGVKEYANVVRSQKEAVEKFKNSQYLGGFHRLIGQAYMKMERGQTAEKALASGVQAVDTRLAELKNNGSKAGGDVRRLTDDKIAMLLLLKKLHQRYNASDKLQQVETQLKEAGHSR